MWYPTLPDLLHLHDRICAVQEKPARVNDMSVVDEAVLAPQRTAEEERSADVIALKCAALLIPLVLDTPFQHCSDRIAYSIAQRFVDRNGFVLTTPLEEVLPAFESVRASEIEVEELATWLHSQMRTRFDVAHRDRIFTALDTLAEVKEDLSHVAGHAHQVEEIDAVGQVLAQQMASLFRLGEEAKEELRDRFPSFWAVWNDAMMLEQN